MCLAENKGEMLRLGLPFMAESAIGAVSVVSLSLRFSHMNTVEPQAITKRNSFTRNKGVV